MDSQSIISFKSTTYLIEHIDLIQRSTHYTIYSLSSLLYLKIFENLHNVLCFNKMLDSI